MYKIYETDRYPIPYKFCLPDGEIGGVILGVHGFSGSKDGNTQSAVAEAGVKQNYAVICFDFPTHGTSTAEKECLTVENCRKDLLTMANLCREQFPDVPKCLFASSFGGYMSLLCKEDLPEFRMVLRAPAVTMGEHVLLDLLETTEDAFRQCGTLSFGFERIIEVPFRFYEGLKANKVMNKPFENPILILHGDSDEVVPIDDVRQFCASHRNAYLVTMPGARHNFKKDETDAAIRDALRFWRTGTVED